MIGSIKGFRTVLFSVVMAIGMLIGVWSGTDTTDEVAKVQSGIDVILTTMISVWLIGSIWLRAITDSPIFQQFKSRW